VDDSWRCSNDFATATDGDGSLVNWIEVEPPRKLQNDEEWGLGWAPAGGAAAVIEDGKQYYTPYQPPNICADDDACWTTTIPPPLALYQHLEELASLTPQTPTPPAQSKTPNVPAPPQLPRHLEKVILNATAREIETITNGNTPNAVVGTGVDDNSLLPVPNHVVLNHLTASAIRSESFRPSSGVLIWQ
jgi:5'-AMP-activated protein kinase regulatory beta subunit